VLSSSNSGSPVNFSAGTKFVFCDYPAGRAVYLDTATNATLPNLTLSGNLTFSSTAQRITADMSNATVSNRFAFQTSTTNGNTQVNAIPNGTSTISQFIAYNNADSNNASSVQLAALSTTTRLLAGQTGTGSYLPLTFFTNGSEQARIDTSGNLGIGTSSPLAKLQIKTQTNGNAGFANSTSVAGGVKINCYNDAGSSSAPFELDASTLQFNIAAVEKMRLDSSGNLGLGMAPSPWASNRSVIQLKGGTTAGGAYLVSGSATQVFLGTNAYSDGASFIYLTSAQAALYAQSLGEHVWYNAASGTAGNAISLTQAMTLTAAGILCVGATSNTSRGGGNTTLLTYKASGTNYLDIQCGSSGDSGLVFSTASSGNYGLINYSNSVGALLFYTTSTERMRIDSSGNLGIGTTSPAFALGSGLEVERAGIATLRLENSSGSNGIEIAADSTTNGIRFYGLNNAPFVFAPNATERMRLDSSGNLGIGTNSPSTYGAVVIIRNQNSDARMWVRNDDAGSSSRCSYVVNASGNSWSMGMGSTANNGNALTWLTDVGGGNNEMMRLTTSGNLGLSAGNAPTQVLNLYRTGSTNAIMAAGNSNTGLDGTWFGVDTAGNGIVNVRGAFPLIFSTSSLERARIDSSGRVIINGTTQLYTSTLTLYRTGNSYNLTSSITGTGNEGHVVFENGNGAVGTIFTNGTATAYNTSSDYRLKNTIAPMTGALAKVALLKPCTYKWNADGSDGQGFIAHELAEVVPQCVTGEKDAVDAEGKPRYQGVDTSFLVATLTAAIQELTARVAQLESK
jgi:hypothetical protein